MAGVWQMFDKMSKLGEGSYGSVYLARSKISNDFYAIKVLKNQTAEYKYMDIPYTSMREVSILKSMDHENIVRLLRVYFDYHSFAMIFAYHPQNLKSFIDQRRLSSSYYVHECRLLMAGILKGIDYIHRRGVLHRDLKPENILIDAKGNPVVCDFGLSRNITQPLREFTNKIMTLGYRAPELLFGETEYSIDVDIWAVGCIFAEMFLGRPLFIVKSELELLFKLCSVLGTPTTDSFPNLKTYLAQCSKGFILPKTLEGPRLHEILVNFGEDVTDLISRFLIYNPNKRITCYEALQHPFFKK